MQNPDYVGLVAEQGEGALNVTKNNSYDMVFFLSDMLCSLVILSINPQLVFLTVLASRR